MTNKIYTLLLFLVTLFRSPRTGGDSPIITDRPDMTESASSVSKGLLQLELGGSWQRHTNAKITTTSLTHSNLLLRYGISINTELRLGTARRKGYLN
ncbi:MAG: hypothetical protein U5L09_10845 [Bacteroidales bacterium]|nr:hypothetical protein [Bacteroidales bacterium]